MTLATTRIDRRSWHAATSSTRRTGPRRAARDPDWNQGPRGYRGQHVPGHYDFGRCFHAGHTVALTSRFRSGCPFRGRRQCRREASARIAAFTQACCGWRVRPGRGWRGTTGIELPAAGRHDLFLPVSYFGLTDPYSTQFSHALLHTI